MPTYSSPLGLPPELRTHSVTTINGPGSGYRVRASLVAETWPVPTAETWPVPTAAPAPPPTWQPFTRVHLGGLAEVIFQAPIGSRGWIARKLADHFATTNRRFDRARWLAACNVSEN